MSTNFEDLILRDATGNRPTAGVPGRLFYDTTLEKWQRDTGADWEDCEPAGATVDAADVTYTPNVATDWDGDADPGDVDGALDQLAERVDDLEGAGVGGGDSTVTDVYASRPAASNDGDLFLPSDGFAIERDTGAAWVPWGPIFPLTAPVPGDFSWVNQGAATLTTTYGGMFLESPVGASMSINALVKSAPSTPYTITALIIPNLYPANYQIGGVCFRQSSDGKLILFGFLHTTNFLLEVNKKTNPTTDSGQYVGLTIWRPTPIFLRIQDNGTNRICQFGYDGINFHTLHTIGRTDFLTADQVGIYTASINATYKAGVNLLSWKEA